MSDAIDKLLNELKQDIASTEKSVYGAVKTDELTENQADAIAETLGNLEDKAESVQEQVKDKRLKREDAMKRARKYQRRLNKLKKQAGESVRDMTKVGKAQPRPINNNPNNVRCYMRYNNQGNIYRVCDSGGKPKKPPAQITKPISVQEFLDKLGKSYGELTDGQRNEYHRIDMANRRFAERGQVAQYQETLDDVLQAQRRAGGLLTQRTRQQEAKAITEYKIILKEREARFRKENNVPDNVPLIEQNKIKAGISEKAQKRLKKKLGIDPDKDIKITRTRKKLKKNMKNITDASNQNIKEGQKSIVEVGKELFKLQDEIDKLSKKIEKKQLNPNYESTSDPDQGALIQLQMKQQALTQTKNKLNKNFKNAETSKTEIEDGKYKVSFK